MSKWALLKAAFAAKDSKINDEKQAASIHSFQGFKHLIEKKKELWGGFFLTFEWESIYSAAHSKIDDLCQAIFDRCYDYMECCDTGECLAWIKMDNHLEDAKLKDVIIGCMLKNPEVRRYNKSHTKVLLNGHHYSKESINPQGAEQDDALLVGFYVKHPYFTPVSPENEFWNYTVHVPNHHADTLHGCCNGTAHGKAVDLDSASVKSTDQCECTALVIHTREKARRKAVNARGVLSNKLHNVDNTGNVCVWPAASILLHTLLTVEPYHSMICDSTDPDSAGNIQSKCQSQFVEPPMQSQSPHQLAKHDSYNEAFTQASHNDRFGQQLIHEESPRSKPCPGDEGDRNLNLKSRSTRRKRILELGGGSTALAGLGLAVAGCCRDITLTDGHPDCVANQRVCIEMNRIKSGLSVPSKSWEFLYGAKGLFSAETEIQNETDNETKLKAHVAAGHSLEANNSHARTPDRRTSRETDNCSDRNTAVQIASHLLHWSPSLNAETVRSITDGGRSKFDVVIASDCLFFREFHSELLSTLRSVLQPVGDHTMKSPPSSSSSPPPPVQAESPSATTPSAGSHNIYDSNGGTGGGDHQGGVALFLQPPRDGTMEAFRALSYSYGFVSELIEDYNPQVTKLREQFRTAKDSSYKEDVHYPWMLILRLRSDTCIPDTAIATDAIS